MAKDKMSERERIMRMTYTISEAIAGGNEAQAVKHLRCLGGLDGNGHKMSLNHARTIYKTMANAFLLTTLRKK